ncbi:MAG: cell division protein FtsZ [Abditibacteriota bacterium]|nr:cell division protein FtsZ [Abditibacteriota bacterium]
MANGAKIKVLGVGGAGMNAVHRMMESGLEGVEFVVMNTDQQVLDMSTCKRKIVLGERLTHGLGAGGNPEVGKQAAEDSREEIEKELMGGDKDDKADMVFITAGMGGGTGTGAAPVVAELSRKLGILTVGIVTLPFLWEGGQRAAKAEEGVKHLKENVDTLITIPNSKLSEVCDKKITLKNAFLIADETLKNGVQGISDIITQPGLINVDFADVQNIMKDKGSALMGIGIASGENRAKIAAEAACRSKLLDTSIENATGILVNITVSEDFELQENIDAMSVINSAATANNPNTEVIFGVVYDNKLKTEDKDEIKITVVATGFDQTASPFVNPSVTVGKPKSVPQPPKAEPAPMAEPAHTAPKPAPAEQKQSFSKPSGNFKVPDFMKDRK